LSSVSILFFSKSNIFRLIIQINPSLMEDTFKSNNLINNNLGTK